MSDEQVADGRVLLVGSSGGHLAQLIALGPWWADRDRCWVTFETADAVSQLDGERVVFAHHPTTRNIPNLIRNFGVAFRTLRRERPELIVSTGAAVAVPFFLLGRIFGVRTVYIEVYDRITSRTLTGRLVRPLSSGFFVQWDQQVPLYRGAQVIGRLL